jgi:alanyl-tRNA synthetase
MMTSDEIRSTYLEFFEERGHLRLPSASLIPANDPSALFTVAGMHPLKPYFAGTQQPPRNRVTSCQKTFRTVDIDIIGTTTRHLTMFEMLGNFSFGDYFKADAARFAWELSIDGFGFDADDIWITVFGGDDELGLGADTEAIEAWLEIGVPRDRIVECPRSENFWQAGPTGPCGPCSELYLDRGLELGTADDLPGGENERFLEYWNLVFMQMSLDEGGTVTPLPAKNIDTGLGLNRMAAIKQGKTSVFETDQFAPLVALGEELSGHRYGSGADVDRALRVLADHSRAIAFLIGDGVVPSNTDRGSVLRRIMRRAILRGKRTLGLEPGFLQRYADLVTELMGSEYRELHEHGDTIAKWLAAEEESFGQTLDQGMRLLDEMIEHAKASGAEGISAQDAFKLHDTYGFPKDLTLEIAAENGLGVDEEGFEGLMEDARTLARQSRRQGGADAAATKERAQELVAASGFTSEFTGYQAVEQETTVGAVQPDGDGHALVKLLESPFYATGGGQIADSGSIACAAGDCLAVVEDVLRVGADQVLAVRIERGELEPGERVHAHVDRSARHATECNHTATHLLHAALREQLGTHVRQMGSYVGPDKLRFDFTHGQGLSADELRAVEDQVNAWIVANHPVRALSTTLDEAKRLGAMALFDEKYGDVVRMVEVGDGSFSRELCGGTHVRETAAIGLLKVTAETSSAANVRRIEALTGPEAVAVIRAHDRALSAAAHTLRSTPEQVPNGVAELRAKVKELEKAIKAGAAAGSGNGATDVEALIAAAGEIDGARVLIADVPGLDQNALLALADRLKGKLGDAAIVLASAHADRVDLVASVAPALVSRGLHAGEVVKAAAGAVGGGGGGRDTLARAGGRQPERLPEAITAARQAIESALQPA